MNNNEILTTALKEIAKGKRRTTPADNEGFGRGHWHTYNYDDLQKIAKDALKKAERSAVSDE